MREPTQNEVDEFIRKPPVGSEVYYLVQMRDRLIQHGEYRVRWEWAIRSMAIEILKRK